MREVRVKPWLCPGNVHYQVKWKGLKISGCLFMVILPILHSSYRMYFQIEPRAPHSDLVWLCGGSWGRKCSSEARVRKRFRSSRETENEKGTKCTTTNINIIPLKSEEFYIITGPTLPPALYQELIGFSWVFLMKSEAAAWDRANFWVSMCAMSASWEDLWWNPFDTIPVMEFVGMKRNVRMLLRFHSALVFT